MHDSPSRCFAYISVRNSWTGCAPFFLYFLITESNLFLPMYGSVGEMSENEIQSTSGFVQLRTKVLNNVWWSGLESEMSSCFPFTLDLLMLDELKSEVFTPPVYIHEGSADSAPAALTVDTTARTQVSKDPFLIDWAGVTDFSFNIVISQSPVVQRE